MDPLSGPAAPVPDAGPATAAKARLDLLGGVLFGALAVAVILGGWRLPGDSGLFPVLIGALLLVGSIGSCAKAIRAGGLSAPPPGLLARLDRGALARALVAAGALGAYALALRPLGYFTATFVLLLVVPPALGYRRPVWILVNAVATTGLLWLVFVGLFDRPLPREIFLR